MNSSLKFLKYGVENLEYTADNNNKIEITKLKPQIECNIIENPKVENKFRLELGIRIGDRDHKDYDFFVKATIFGDFELDKQFQTGELIPSALSILFPYLRSVITDLTSKGDKKPIILPPINVYDLLSEAILDNEN